MCSALWQTTHTEGEFCKQRVRLTSVVDNTYNVWKMRLAWHGENFDFLPPFLWHPLEENLCQFILNQIPCFPKEGKVLHIFFARAQYRIMSSNERQSAYCILVLLAICRCPPLPFFFWQTLPLLEWQKSIAIEEIILLHRIHVKCAFTCYHCCFGYISDKDTILK
jgi:hypothetical protein